VDARHLRIGDERHSTLSRDELSEPLQKAALDTNARGDEDNVVEIASDEVCDLRVQGPPFLVEAREVLVTAGERTIGALDALPGHVYVDVEPDDERVLLQQSPNLGRRDGAAAEIDDQRLGPLEDLAGNLRFSPAKGGLPLVEELDGDVHVGLDVRETERAGDRRLAGSHEADEREVPV
jgi:hypothetical protein